MSCRPPSAAPRPSRPIARPVLLTTLIHLTLAGALASAWTPAAQAQAQAGQAGLRHYAIPAGPLDAALARFVTESGVPLAAPPALVQGRQSPGLQGSFSAETALARLLDGSGLAATRGADGSYIVHPRSGGDSTVTLAPVAVTGFASDGATEGTGSYTTGATATATRLPLTLRETPQSVTVVTRQKMDDFALTDINDVLQSTSSVVVNSQGADGANFFSRGFALQMQYDGMMNPIGIGENNISPAPDSAYLDRVEVLQGAAGLLAGAGEPGGTVNLVRKRPTGQFQAQLEAQVGSWDKRRLVGDVSGPLVASGKVRGRAVALWDDSDTFVDHAYDNKKGFYGVVDADITPTTTIGASFQWQRNKGNNHLGVPTAPDGGDLRLRRSAFFAGANDGIDKEYRMYTVDLTQQLPAGWKLRASYSHNEAKADNASSYLYGTLDPATGNGLRLYQQLLKRDFSANSYDLHASGPVSLFGRDHELVFGVNASTLKARSRGYYGAGMPVDIYRFDADIPRLDGPLAPWSKPNETLQRGAYGVARLNLADPLKLILGTRVSGYEYRNEGVPTQKERGVVSPYAGLVYDIDGEHSAYVSYSDIFKPQDNLNASGGTVDPIVGKNYEIGLKGEYLGGRLNTSAALFRLEQTNLAQTDPSVPYDESNICKGYCYSASGLVVSKGVDLGINGELSPGWQLGAGYTYVHSAYAKGEDKGKPYAANTPDHLLRVYTTYRLPGTRWTIGGNVRAQSAISNSGDGYTIRQGSYTVVGLLAKYQVSRQAEIGLTVDNLFDRRYYSAVGDPWFYNFYGAPRRFALNLRYTL
ncbi:TonB-dependent siderophore receptor [Achromobacter deleyi]|uniref:TonB-dependent siderophore receptor n=1 Tax=Achromobacter deleyi TaxID=1353891 RepID=A0A7T4E0V5_9BURK|nr:TonB-dependent siderophore receptor [Achromobacter deleyi]QQB32587.1 TonB-dependent siderophore receptor [Achromobacter deleyi]